MEHTANNQQFSLFISALAGFALWLVGLTLLTRLSLLEHGFVYSIPVYEKITVDLYGAVFPALLSVVFVTLYFIYFKGSFLKILGCFLFAFILSAVSFTPVLTAKGFELQSLPAYLAFFISAVSVLVVFYDEQASKAKTLLSSVSSRMRRNYIVTLLLTFSVSCVSALLLDLSYAPFLNQNPSWGSVNIGGGGLTDGVLFSGLFAFVWTTFFVSLLALIIEILRWSQRKDNALFNNSSTPISEIILFPSEREED